MSSQLCLEHLENKGSRLVFLLRQKWPANSYKAFFRWGKKAPSHHISRKKCLNLPLKTIQVPAICQTKAGILNFSRLSSVIYSRIWPSLLVDGCYSTHSLPPKIEKKKKTLLKTSIQASPKLMINDNTNNILIINKLINE